MRATPSTGNPAALPGGDGQADSPPLFIVLNTGSGPHETGPGRDALREALEGCGRRLHYVPVGAEGLLAACREAARAAAQAGGVLVAAGGDGTVNCAAQAALQHGCPLGVLPYGTFNLFAREHGIPLEPPEAVQALLRGRPEPVQVALVNERVFLVNAAVGLYPKLLEDRENAKQQLKRRRRWIAIVAGLVSLFEWRWALTLDAELDGQVTRLRTPSLFVCNNRVQLRRVGVEDPVVEAVGRGRVAALVAHPLGLAGKLRLLWRAAVGRLGEARDLDSYTLRSLDVSTRSARRLKVSADGEVLWMELPLRFAVSPRPLQLLVPLPEDRAPPE